MNVADLHKAFPDGADVPELLLSLVQWRNEWHRQHPGDYLLDRIGFDLFDCGGDCPSALSSWFGEEAPSAASQFVIWGHNPTGGMFGHWLYDGRTTDTAPVVLLDDEGSQFSSVLANSLTEFLLLVASGDEELFSLSGAEAYRLPALTDLRQWLTQHGVAPRWSLDDVDDILERAAHDHPALGDWIDVLYAQP